MKEELDWSKAQDFELIAEAKSRYPKGTIIKPVNAMYLKPMPEAESAVINLFLDVDFIGAWCNIGTYNALVYSKETGEWAKILNQPETAPKAGDMVEVRDSNAYKWSEQTFRFTGGITSDDHFLVENGSKTILIYKDIRLPQKSEVESYVKVRIENYIYSTKESEINFGIELVKWGQANPDKI